MATTTQSTRVTDPPANSVGRVVVALTGLSNSKVRGLFDHGCVTLNSTPCPQAGDRVQPGDLVDVVTAWTRDNSYWHVWGMKNGPVTSGEAHTLPK